MVLATPSGARVPLRDLADIQVKTGRATINRENNSKVMALKFNVEGRDMGSVVDDAIKAVAKSVKVPEGNFLVWTGEFENQQRAMARLRVGVHDPRPRDAACGVGGLLLREPGGQ